MPLYYASDKDFKLNINDLKLPAFARDFLNYLIVELNRTPKTIFDYGISLQTFFRWVRYVQIQKDCQDFRAIDVSDMEIDEIAHFTRTDIYEYLSFCSTQLENGATARAAKLSAVKRLYHYLQKIKAPDLITSNPAEDIGNPKKEKNLPRYLSRDEAIRLLDAASQDGSRPCRDYCIILWLLSCGMRLSELVNVDVGDVKGDTLRLHGKGRKDRDLTLNGDCVAAYNAYLAERKRYKKIIDEDALFLSQNGTRITGRRVEQIVDKYLLKAGLQSSGYSPHKLRHTAGTLLYQGGDADLLEIKEILGHESVSTTQIYCHTSGKMVKSAMNSMQKILNPNDRKVSDGAEDW